MTPSVLLLILPVAFALADGPVRGFPESETQEQRAREEAARAAIQAPRIRSAMQRMTAEPHHAGSPGSRAVARYLAAELRAAGLETEIEEFEALLPVPTKRMLEMVEPVRFRASLREPAIPQDTTSSLKGQLPAYNAYSGSGDVTAPLVYANYGVQQDYDYLKRLGIDVRGKIVIARYGGSWRGIKAKLAQQHGAVGCLIYSDPRDDGYYTGDPYPKGAARPEGGVQRGSVMDMPLYPGDPLSPGWASEKGSRRLPREEAKTIMQIPVLPISHGDAQPLLEELGGPVAPPSWRGALPFTYHIGPGPAKVRLTLDFNWQISPVYNVIARMPGAVFPDEWVLYGNHHDAWVFGAHDPASGAAALLEAARALGELRRKGWQPKRTLIFAFWDAEEFGLVGSTEWVEKHAEAVRGKAVAYFNSDSNAKGRIGASGSLSLEQFFEGVLRDTMDPDTGKTVLEASLIRDEADPGEAPPRPAAKRLELGPLGAGSDYVAFAHFAGVASLNAGFGRAGLGGVYHSAYDSFDWYARFGDPEFRYGAALAEVMARTMLRMGDAAVLPFEYVRFASGVRRYLDDLRKATEGKALDLSPVKQSLDTLEQNAIVFEAMCQAVLQKGGMPADRLAAVNRVLYLSERELLAPEGLPGREWYKHQIHAPGLLTGYGAKTLPGIREAVEASEWELAQQQADSAARALQRFGARVEEAARLLQAFSGGRGRRSPNAFGPIIGSEIRGHEEEGRGHAKSDGSPSP